MSPRSQVSLNFLWVCFAIMLWEEGSSTGQPFKIKRLLLAPMIIVMLLSFLLQVVNMEFEGGLTAAFSMVAFTEDICKRKTTIYGSKVQRRNSIVTDMQSDAVSLQIRGWDSHLQGSPCGCVLWRDASKIFYTSVKGLFGHALQKLRLDCRHFQNRKRSSRGWSAWGILRRLRNECIHHNEINVSIKSPIPN